MKKKNLLKVIAAATLGGTVALGMALTGCGHTHAFDEEKWGGSDATGHWHLPTCEHKDEKGGFEAHDYGTDGKGQYCLDCNFANPDYVAPQATPLAAPVIELTEDTLSWTAVEHATGYEIYRGDTKVTTVTATTYKITDTEEGSYVYTVKAISSDTEHYSTSPASNSKTYTVAAPAITEGLFTLDGTLIEALEYVAPGDSALKQYGATGIVMNAGDVFTIKLEGETLTHKQGELELWLSDGCHGIDFNQAEGTFTVKAGEARAFQIYAKYYEDNTPCWSIYITDGLKDELHAGGAYLVGTGWSGSSWDISAGNYIDPENGLTVTLSKDADFKITDCLDVESGENRGWAYNAPSFYQVKDDAAGFLNFANVGANGNVKVLAPGEYTITVGGTEEAPIFIFTPAEGVEPAQPEPEFIEGGAYLVGENFDNAMWNLKKENYIDPENGLTVTFTNSSSFKIIYCKNDAPDWNTVPTYAMAEGKEEGYLNLPGSSNGSAKTAGEYTITIGGTAEAPVFVFTPAADLQPDATEYIIHYYIKGAKVTGWKEEQKAEYDMKEATAGSGVYTLTIELAKGDEFMFQAYNEHPETHDVTRGTLMIQKDKLETNDYVEPKSDNTNMLTKVAGTFTFTFNAETNKLTVTCVPDEATEPEFVDGGAYLVGRGFSTTDFNLNKDYYINPDGGLEVNLKVGDLFKIIYCKEDAPDWNTPITYAMAEGKEKGFLNLPDGGNGTVKVAGKYTITIGGTTEAPVYVFTPDASLQPDLTVVKYDGYLVGENFTVGDTTVTNSNGWQLNDFCLVDHENGLTVKLTTESQFKIAASVNNAINWDTYKTSDCVLKDGEFINDGNLKVATAGTYKITVEYDEDGKATFTFELIEADAE